jgi:putative transcriptional regulator
VILNRPTQLRVQDLRPGLAGGDAPVFFGGPVMTHILVALFRSDATPAAAAFHVLKGVYLSMHPALVDPLLERPDAKLRLFAGFSGWAPRQLESELAGDSWYLLPASEELVFRTDTAGLWEELSEQAARKKAALYSKP